MHSGCFSPASSFLLLSCSPFSCLLFLTLLSPHPSSSPSPCLPLVATGEQLALLQYRLSMSSMPCQPHAPPGSGTLHTYQVLLPFHSPPPLWGLLEVNHSHYRSQSRLLLCYRSALSNTPPPVTKLMLADGSVAACFLFVGNSWTWRRIMTHNLSSANR